MHPTAGCWTPWLWRRELHPGQRNSLDALCKRYEVDNSARELHGALLDAEILAEVYLAMTGGQATLDLSLATPAAGGPAQSARGGVPPRGRLRIIRASDRELDAHDRRLRTIDESSDGRCIWRQLEIE